MHRMILWAKEKDREVLENKARKMSFSELEEFIKTYEENLELPDQRTWYLILKDFLSGEELAKENQYIMNKQIYSEIKMYQNPA